MCRGSPLGWDRSPPGMPGRRRQTQMSQTRGTEATMSKQPTGTTPTGGSGRHEPQGSRDLSHRQRTGLLAFRVGLPAALAVSGTALLIAGLSAIGIVLIGTAAIAALVDLFARQTNESDLEREREEQARRTFMQTGRWPRRRG